MKQKFILSIIIFAVCAAASSRPAYAMPPYGFGAVGSPEDVHIDLNAGNGNTINTVNSVSDYTNNQDVIYFDIGYAGTAWQDASPNVPKDGEHIGTLTIPYGEKIGVYAGESLSNMDYGAAHFNDTGLNSGNTALIGHNRGPGGFFIFVKDLEAGQTLTLEAGGITKTYTTAEMYKIHASETELLQQYGDSRLTFITCWEDAKDYRRVVVAYEEGAEHE